VIKIGRHIDDFSDALPRTRRSLLLSLGRPCRENPRAGNRVQVPKEGIRRFASRFVHPHGITLPRLVSVSLT